MKKILAIAGITLRLLIRNGSAATLGLLAIGLAGGIFFAASGDGHLVNELQVRLCYGLYFVAALVNFALMYLGCICLCRDLDQRHFHLIAAAPVHRAQIWLGKYLGLMALGTGIYLGAAAALAACCFIFTMRQEHAAQRQELRNGFLRTWAVHLPDQPPVEELVQREFRRRYAERLLAHGDETSPTDCAEPGHHHDQSDWSIKEQLLKDIRCELQGVPAGGAKTWRFRLEADRAGGQELRILGKFFSQNKRQRISGRWQLAAPGAPPSWEAEFRHYPGHAFEVAIPLAAAPPGPIVELTFRGQDTPALVFPLSATDGIRLLAGQDHLFVNALRLLLVLLLHLGLLLAIALGLAAMFSYSVAIFITIAAYFMSVAADFFLSTMHLQTYGEKGPLYEVLRWVIQLSRGLKSPEAIAPFANGIALPLGELMGTWGWAALATGTVAGLAGIVILTRKEIDRLLQS